MQRYQGNFNTGFSLHIIMGKSGFQKLDFIAIFLKDIDKPLSLSITWVLDCLCVEKCHNLTVGENIV